MIISQNSNDVYYAYTRGRFWRWDESARVWKESHLLAQKFGKAKTAEKHLTPEAFLTSDEFIPMDDYELPEQMLTALRDAKPCKNAPIEPVEEESECTPAQNADAAVTTAEIAVPAATAATPTTSKSGADASASTPAMYPRSSTSGPSGSAAASSVIGGAPSSTGTGLMTEPAHSVQQDKPLTFIREDKCPAFDYSGLTDQTVEDLHFAEDEYRHGKQMAERGLVHMGNAIAAAHDALCGTVVQQLDNGEDGACRTMRKARNNQHSEDTFKSWCLSIGITKDSAYRLLQISALMDGSSPRQRAILEALPPTLLYAAAKPSAPQELVEKVKNGEVTTNKAYQDLLKENQQLRTDRVEAMNRADRAEHKLEAAHADINGLAEQNSRLKDRATAAEAREEEAWKMQSKAETRAQEAEKQLEGSRQVAEAAKLRGDKLKAENDALKKQPITAVVDKEEVERQAREMAAEMTADLRAQLEQAASGSEQDAHSSYDNVLLADRSFQNIGKMVVPSLRRLPPEQREQLTNMLVHTLGQIQGEVSRCL